jgi:hypothetical protein
LMLFCGLDRSPESDVLFVSRWSHQEGNWIHLFTIQFVP